MRTLLDRVNEMVEVKLTDDDLAHELNKMGWNDWSREAKDLAEQIAYNWNANRAFYAC